MRLIGLLLGHGDLFRLTGAKPHGESTLDYPRNAVVLAARAVGIAAFDTPFTRVSDVLGLEREAREAKRHGFDSKACIHRDQVAIYHLGFRNAIQTRPLQVGDTVRQRIRVLRLHNTSAGKQAVVTSLRELVRVGYDQVVFRVEKLELYPSQPESFGEPPAPLRTDAALAGSDPFLEAALNGAPLAVTQRASSPGLARPRERFNVGDVLLHSFARPLGISSNLALSTQFLVTHPIHLDHHRFDQGGGTGIVVSGGLVISMICASAARDLSHVVWEEMITANNVRPVSPNDTVGALSVIIDQADIPGHAGLEALVVKTLGVAGVTPADELVETVIPDALLKPEVGGGRRYDDICRSYGPAALEGRILGEVLRRVVRIKPG